MAGRSWSRTACRAILLAAIAAAAAVQADDRIRREHVQFESGQSSIVIEDSISDYDVIDYLVDARAGQTLTVELETDHGSNYFNVIPPDEDSVATFIGSSAGKLFSGTLDLDGDWKVRVYLMRAAARRRETANYALSLSVTGLPDAERARAANDFGPSSWDARGHLHCAHGGQPMQAAACPFKVIRYGDESGATVFAVAPASGRLRILYFLEGTWSTDSSEIVSASRRADLWSVVVGNEAYEIPDAVLFGG